MTIRIRVTPEEFECIQSIAAEEGQSVSEYVREQVLSLEGLEP